MTPEVSRSLEQPENKLHKIRFLEGLQGKAPTEDFTWSHSPSGFEVGGSIIVQHSNTGSEMKGGLNSHVCYIQLSIKLPDCVKGMLLKRTWMINM